jgi:hypothetical protein
MIRAILLPIVVTCCNSITSSQDLRVKFPDLQDSTSPQVTFISQQNITPISDKDDTQIGKPSGKTELQDRYISFPTAGVKLIRPDGFDPANLFNGFQQPSTKSSVMVTTIPGSFAQLVSGFTAKQLQARGLRLKSKENVSIDGNPGLLINLTQTAYGNEFTKWVVIFGNDRVTKIVTAAFPTAHAGNLSARLKSVLLSAKLDATPPSASGSDVGFTIAASEKVKSVPGVGKMLAYTKDGIIPANSPADPLFIVTPSFSEMAISDKRQFAIQRLLKISHTKIDSITATTAIKIDGLDGYEIVADAKDATSDTPLVIYQVMLFDDRSYILMQGLVGTKGRAEYLPAFQSMAHSFKRQPSVPTKKQ